MSPANSILPLISFSSDNPLTTERLNDLFSFLGKRNYFETLRGSSRILITFIVSVAAKDYMDSSNRADSAAVHSVF